jgi:very-short-patch-repair endonuclease
MPLRGSLRRRARARARELRTLRTLRPHLDTAPSPSTDPPPAPSTDPPPAPERQIWPGKRAAAAVGSVAATAPGERQIEPGKRAGSASDGTVEGTGERQIEPGKRAASTSRRRRVSDVDARIGVLAARQHALLTSEQAEELGLTASSRDRRVRAGRLEYVLPGVLRVCGAPRTWEQEVMAACLWAGPAALAARQTAACLWTLDGVARPSRVEVLVPAQARVRSEIVRVAMSEQVLDFDRSTVGGIPCASVDRTLCDLAAAVPVDALELAVEDALRRRLTTVERLRWRNELLGRRRGTARLRRLLEDRIEGRPAESVWEVKLLQLLRAAGLPDPVRQLDVFADDGTFVGRVDLAYPERRLGIEFDGNRWHSGRAKVDAQSARRNAFTRARWRLLHVTSTMMRAPSAVVTLVADEYERP